MSVLKTAEGCRPDQLFGFWSIEETRFGRMVELAKTADLQELRAEATAQAKAAAEAPPYTRAPDGIARIDINGPMTKYPTSFQSLFGGTSTLKVREALRAASRDPDVVGIMLVIDSPGGTVAGTGDLADEIRKADGIKPVYSYIEDLGASAALWAAVAARKVHANASAEVGSIGAYTVVADTSQVYAQRGVKVHVISSAPPVKGAGVEGSEVTPAQVAEWERRIKDVADVFVSGIAAGRRMTKERAESLATGQVWVAEKARDLGLIDDVVSLEEATRRLRSEAMSEKDTQAALKLAEEAEAKATAEKLEREKAEKQVADLSRRLEATEKEKQALATEKRTTRFAAEAEAIGAPREFAAVLDQLEAAAGADVYGQLKAQLDAFAAQVKAGPLFSEKGAGGGAPADSAMGRLEAIANELVKKGQAIDYYAGFKLACERNPDLVKQTRPSGKEA